MHMVGSVNRHKPDDKVHTHTHVQTCIQYTYTSGVIHTNIQRVKEWLNTKALVEYRKKKKKYLLRFCTPLLLVSKVEVKIKYLDRNH